MIESMIEIERVLIRSGFGIRIDVDSISLFDHSCNIEYLNKVNNCGNFGLLDIVNRKFSPISNKISEKNFVKSIERLCKGVGGGPSYELEVMDPYMGGIIRWMNEAGVDTGYSCVGHLHKGVPHIGSYNTGPEVIFDFLSKYTSRISIRGGSVVFTGINTKLCKVQGNRYSGFPYQEYSFLLDIAEMIHGDLKGRLINLRDNNINI